MHSTPSRVALAWVRQWPGVAIPILGTRTLSQLQDNLGVLDPTTRPGVPAPTRCNQRGAARLSPRSASI
ncbi:MAG: aldo/keto reductase [Roseiflexaceae bacterium]|nr:aldo/keto reductase [Roseiflexaceae bacterium]